VSDNTDKPHHNSKPRTSSRYERLRAVNTWHLSIAAWVIQDGNYPDFRRGQRVEFAVEFYAPDGLIPRRGAARTARHEGGGWYFVDATVAAMTENAWVIDCGLLAYVDKPAPEGLSVGDGVQGRVLLSVDHYFYFEVLANQPEVPELIYTWDLLRIERETAPHLLNGTQTMYVRDETKRGLAELDATNAWEDDDGHAEYVFECSRLDIAPKKTSITTA
jgi:hypothetical protein